LTEGSWNLMVIKINFREWIMLYIMVGIFVAITAILINFYLEISGSVLVTLSLIVIFLIFKLYQYIKKDDENDTNPKDDEE